MQKILTTIEAAEYLGYSEYTLRKSRSTGELCGIKTPDFMRWGGRSIRYTKDSLDAWIKEAREVVQHDSKK